MINRICLFELSSEHKNVIKELVAKSLVDETNLDKINKLVKLLVEINTSVDVPLPIRSDFTIDDVPF